LSGCQRRILSGMWICFWAVIAGAVGWAWQPARAGSPSFVPAYIQPGVKPFQLILLPLEGPEISVPAPAELPAMRIVAFSPDGKAIYAEPLNPLNHEGIYKIEFHPARASVVPGSAGLGMVQCLTVSPSSGRLIVFSRSLNGGIFEIDPATATNRRLPDGLPSSCGGTGGFLSPDGKRAIRNSGKQLDLIDVETGASRVIKGLGADATCNWSPNGQRIECSGDGEIAVIDPSEPFRRRTFQGSLGEWSPDSKYLLRVKSQLPCLPTLYGESLELLDVDTGKRELVKSSHCRISGGPYGWIDSTVVTK
jgi:WD40 repeat protein